MIDNTESRTALIVDDDPTARFLMKAVLEQLGCRVVEAKLGVDGLQQVRDIRPDVLVLDVLMPHMDGLDTLRYLRSDPDFASLPVIVVSVLQDDHRTVKEMHSLDLLGFFTKPLDHGHLSRKLTALFARLDHKVDGRAG